MTDAQEKCLDDCRDIARRMFKRDYSGHDWFHMERVELMSDYIADSEPNVDPFRLKLTALLHDFDDRKLSPETAETLGNANKFMSDHSDVIPDGLKDAILEDIRMLPYSKGQTPASIEGRIVQDADRIDALGAIGIARVFAFGGAHEITMYDPDIPPTHKPGCDSTSVNHFTEKIMHIADTINTKKGRLIARQRTRYMAEYLSQLEKELEVRGKQET